MRRIVWLAALAACGKSEEKPEPAAPKPVAVDAGPAADPACAAKARELEPWIAQLHAEEATHEIDFVYELVVVDRAAKDVDPITDAVYVKPGAIEVWDRSESNRVDGKPGKGAAQKAVAERLKAIKAMGEEGDRIRFDVDKAATWGDVARSVEAAAAAGYQEAVFAFTATSQVAPPAGVEPRTTSIEVFDQAAARLEELGKTCRGIGPYADADDIAEALVRCGCAVDVEEIRRHVWVRSRWGQARPRTSVTVKLGGATTIEQPKATPWSEAHARLLEGGDGAAVTLKAR